MALEILVGLHIVDEKSLQFYRNEMMPILESYRAEFRDDFKITEILKSKTETLINHTFTIFFPDQSSRDSFISNAEYIKTKQSHIEKSVTDATIIASYEQ